MQEITEITGMIIKAERKYLKYTKPHFMVNVYRENPDNQSESKIP